MITGGTLCMLRADQLVQLIGVPQRQEYIEFYILLPGGLAVEGERLGCVSARSRKKSAQQYRYSAPNRSSFPVRT